MKIKLKNFGPIDHFEFDLDKDLHVIYGENNLGKSYAMSAVYLILKNLNNLSNKQSNTHEIVNRLSQLDQYELKDTFIKEYINFNIINFAHPFINSLKLSFPNLESFHSSFLPYVSISFKDSSFSFVIDKESFQAKNIKVSFDDHIFILLERFKRDLLNDQTPTHIVDSVMISSQLERNDAYDLYFLPASRSGLYQAYNNLGKIFAKLSQWRYQLKEKIEIPALQEYIADYFLQLNSVKTKNLNSKLNPIAEKIEKEILKGSITYNTEEGKVEYKHEKSQSALDVSMASSMISELAPFIIFFKYIIGVTGQDIEKNESTTLHKSPPILFIEEPEAHLHPKIQVEMMKIFVELVKAGVKVVMTTHSDYMKDTLSNLLLSGEITPEKVASYRFVMGENGSYDAGDMKATQEGVEDHNFTSVAVELYEERVRLLEKRYESNDAQ